MEQRIEEQGRNREREVRAQLPKVVDPFLFRLKPGTNYRNLGKSIRKRWSAELGKQVVPVQREDIV